MRSRTLCGHGEEYTWKGCRSMADRDSKVGRRTLTLDPTSARTTVIELPGNLLFANTRANLLEVGQLIVMARRKRADFKVEALRRLSSPTPGKLKTSWASHTACGVGAPSAFPAAA
jgi:hypothetical protein